LLGLGNTVDLLGNKIATPVMIYGFMPHSEMVVISSDGYGNFCATTGSGGGNASTIIDTPEYTMPNPVQMFAREPTSGKRMAIPLTANN